MEEIIQIGTRGPAAYTTWVAAGRWFAAARLDGPPRRHGGGTAVFALIEESVSPKHRYPDI